MHVARPPYEALRRGAYRKSRHSGAASSCVMVATVGGWVGVQDSKTYGTPAPERDTLGFTRSAFAAFVGGVKDGEFDLG